MKKGGFYLPLAPLVGVAKLLVSSEDQGQIIKALNENGLYQSLFGHPVGKQIIRQFLKTGTFELPAAKRVNYEQLEMLQRQGLAALIAA